MFGSQVTEPLTIPENRMYWDPWGKADALAVACAWCASPMIEMRMWRSGFGIICDVNRSESLAGLSLG